MTSPAEDLLTRAFTDPTAVLVEGAARLPGLAGAQRAHVLRAMGNACRELRRVDESVEYLTTAVAVAVALGDDELEGQCSMSLAAALSYSGDFEESVRVGRHAVELLADEDRIVAMSQLAGVLQRAGRNDEALRVFSEAIVLAEHSTDETILGELWTNRGVLRGWAGEIDAAEDDTTRALELFEAHGWTKRSADMRHNLAWLAGRRGDLVEAFRRFDAAQQTYESLGLTGASVFPDRCEALIAAGLTNEALVLAERAVAGLQVHGADVDRGEALMLVARAALLAEEETRAMTASAEAAALFAAQERSAWWAAATSLEIDARVRAGATTAADEARIAAVIAATAAAGLAPACAEARIVAAELAAARHRWSAVTAELDAVDRATLGLATKGRYDLLEARTLAHDGAAADALAVCATSVDEFGDLTAHLGGTELRAHVARHAGQLVQLGLELAVAAGDASVVFAWAERQRASALAVPPVRPPGDAESAADLDRLRALLTTLDASAGERRGDDGRDREAARLSDAIRRRARHAEQHAPTLSRPGTLEDIAGAAVAWVSYVEVAGRLLALRAVDGAVRVVELGDVLVARREVSLLRGVLAMHLSAVGRGLARDPTRVLRSAEVADALLLAPLELPPGRVVVSPVAGLHDLPWGVLPSLADRPFVLAPSVALWKRCVARGPGGGGSVLVAAGPSLALASAEAACVAACHDAATVLTGGAATVGRVGAAIAAADVVHLVCHGQFSRENPMFSSLQLADGPMFVYDLERIAPPPAVVVLSACHAGSHATPTGGEILGLTASLLATGPRSVIAGTVPIPDTLATVDVMVALHTALAAGIDPADALRRARTVDPMVAGAFAAHGAH